MSKVMHCSFCDKKIKNPIDIYMSRWFRFYSNAHVHCKNKTYQYERVAKQRAERFNTMNGNQGRPVAPLHANPSLGVELTPEQMLAVGHRFMKMLRETTGNGNILNMQNLLVAAGHSITSAIRERKEIEHHISTYRKAFGIGDNDALTRREMLIVCNGGILPSTEEAKELAEEKRKRYIAGTISNTFAKKKAAAKTKGGDAASKAQNDSAAE